MAVLGQRHLYFDEAVLLFPDSAIVILREAVWQPDATRSYDMMSGGFVWSDEPWRSAARECRKSDSWAFRYVLGYRASLIRECPLEELAEPWLHLKAECPKFPGLRPARFSPNLRQELEAIHDQRMAELEAFFEAENGTE